MKNDIQAIAEKWCTTRNDKDFKILYNRLRPGIWKYLSSFESDFDERNSLVNVVFAKAVKCIDQYSPEKGKFSTWIYRIAFTEALLEKNRKGKTTSLDSLVEEGFAVKDDGYEAEADHFDLNFCGGKEEAFQELYNKTIEAFKNCKDTQISQAFYKQHFEHKTMEQIGQELGICTNTAKQKIFKGKKIVREALLKSDKELVERYREFYA